MPRPSERYNKFGFCPIYSAPREKQLGFTSGHVASDARRAALRYIWKQKTVELDDLPEDGCKRCGWFLLSTDWIYRLAGKEEPFYKACALHDDLYTPELRPPDMTRKEADDLFLEAMKTIIREEGKGSLWMAYTYYGIARSLGGLFWDSGVQR